MARVESPRLSEELVNGVARTLVFDDYYDLQSPFGSPRSNGSDTVWSPRGRPVSRLSIFGGTVCRWFAGFWLLLCVEFYDIAYHPVLPQADLAESDHDMVAAWDLRYVRKSDTGGEQIALLKKTRNGHWAGVFPDGSLMEVELGHRATVRTQPLPEVQYVPLPVMSADRKAQVMTAVQAAITAHTLPALQKYGSASGRSPLQEVRRFCGTLAGLPIFAARWARWALRSRSRFGAAMALNFIIYEAFSHLGLYTWVNGKVTRAWTIYQEVREWTAETSEGIHGWLVWFEALHEGVSKYIEPSRLGFYFWRS